MRPRHLPVLLSALLAAACGGAGGERATPDPARVAELEQQVATLSRSDAISREANRKLQDTLAEKDAELASLRADLAVYERFLGQAAPRGLAVHELTLQAQDAQVWHFVAALTQTAQRERESTGALTVAVEGSQDGRMQRLDWPALRQDPEAAPVPYRLRYLQRVEGDVILPPGFKPVRVLVRLQPAGGRVLEQSFPWAEVARG